MAKRSLKIRGGRPPKNTKKNDDTEEVRTGTQKKKLAEIADKKERAKYANKSNVLKNSKPKSLTRLTEEDEAELARVKAHDNPKLIIKVGNIIGVFHRGRWALVRARRVAKARGTRVSVHHQAASSGDAPQPAAPTSETAAPQAAQEDPSASGAATTAASDAGAGAAVAVELTEKEKHAAVVRVSRAKQNGTNENNVLTYKGEALVDVIRTDEFEVADGDDDEDDVVTVEEDGGDDDVDIEVEDEGDHTEEDDDAADSDNIEDPKNPNGLYVRGERFQRRLIATAAAVREYSTTYEELTAFDANPKRKLRDVANMLARKESQDEGFVVGNLAEELRPGEVKQGTGAAAAGAAHAAAP